MSHCPPHHWLIPPGGQRVVEGCCRRCGATREFRNDLDESYEMSESRREQIRVAATKMWEQRRREQEEVKS
jgi:hypothetical protein